MPRKLNVQPEKSDCCSSSTFLERLFGPSGVYLPPTQSPARRRRFSGRQVYIYHQHNHPREGDAFRAVRCISTTNTITREKATLYGPSGVYLPPTQSPARRRRFTGRQVYIYHQHNHPREGDALRAVRCISTTNTITREKATLYGPSGVYLPPTQSPARRRRFTGRQVYIYHQHNHAREGDAFRAVRCISTTNTITREKATLFGPSGVYLPPTQSPARRRRLEICNTVYTCIKFSIKWLIVRLYILIFFCESAKLAGNFAGFFFFKFLASRVRNLSRSKLCLALFGHWFAVADHIYDLYLSS